MFKKSKSIITLSLILTLSMGITGCTSSTDSDESKEVLKVGVVLGEGGANDQSFNQSSLVGLDRAIEELGIEGSYKESFQDSDYIPNIDSYIDDESDIIMGTGYTIAESMLEAANLYPEQKFVMIDHNYEEEGKEIPENMVCVTFDEEESAYLVGLIAGRMTETNKVGFIGGMKAPNILRFEEGYKSGVKAANPDAEVLSQFANTYDDAALGKSIANQMYSNDADIIFAAAGNVGSGMIEAAKEKNKYAIGVDMDQNKLAPDNVLSSAMKRVDMGVFDIIKKASEGEFKGGEAVVYGLKEEAIGLAPTTDKNVPKEVLDYVEEERQKLIDSK